MRLARKPGLSAETEGTLPIRLQNSMAVSMVAWEVWRPLMISTPLWMGTGFMKWVLTTREEAEVSVGSEVVAAAILVMEMLEVLVARIAWEGQMRARSEKIFCLSEGISGTASMTMSTSLRSSMLVVGCRRERVWSAISWVILDFETSLERSLSANAMPLSSAACWLSTSVMGTEAFCAATRAMPRPIWPAPTTPSFLISWAMLAEEESWRLSAESLEDAVAAMEDLGDGINLLEILEMADMLGEIASKSRL